MKAERIIKTLRNSWARAKRLAGIPRPFRMYDLRHFYATHSLARRASIIDISYRLGHVNTDKVTKVYTTWPSRSDLVPFSRSRS